MNKINPLPECQNQTLLVGTTLTAVVVLEDYTAAITAVLRLQATIQSVNSVNHLHTKTYQCRVQVYKYRNPPSKKGIKCIRRRVIVG